MTQSTKFPTKLRYPTFAAVIIAITAIALFTF